MNDLTVACGCGRKMTLDTMRGRGAYRCGCSARIKIEEPALRSDTCMGTVKDQRCRKTSVTPKPYLLCDEHLDDLKVALDLIRPMDLPEYADRMAAAQMCAVNVADDPEMDQEYWLARLVERKQRAQAEKWAKADHDQLAVERRLEPGSVVYFIRMGDMIKIGYTSDLIRRVQQLSLTMGHVLATVPGASFLEQQMHDKFAALREHGEWFRAEPPLLDYIAQLKPNRRVS